MYRRRLQTTLLLLAAMSAAALTGATPVAAAVDRATIALRTTYLLRADLSFAAGTIAASETITIRNDSKASISKVNLSVMPRAFGELTSLSGVSVDGKRVASRWTNNSNLEVQLGKVLAVGAGATIRLRFAVLASDVIGTSLEGRLSKVNGIMQVGHWFPIVSDGHPTRYPGDAQYTRAAKRIRLELTTDSASVRIAAPGSRIYSSGRSHVYELVNARDFAFGASPAYRAVSGWAGGVHISTYYTTGDGPSALASAKAALTTFESAFGQYQWGRYVIAQTGRRGSGNEYPGIVFLGAAQFGVREVVAHETAHQWWYAMAGNDQLREPWLDEGIAEFSAAYWFGSLEDFESARPLNSTIYEFPNLPAPVTSTQPDSYDQTIYMKAARFLDVLRLRMGSPRFFAGLRALFAANRNGVITSREFYDTMAAQGASTTFMRLYLRF